MTQDHTPAKVPVVSEALVKATYDELRARLTFHPSLDQVRSALTAALSGAEAKVVAWQVRDNPDESEEDGKAFDVLTPDGEWRTCIAVGPLDARDCIREEWEKEQEKRADYIPASPVPHLTRSKLMRNRIDEILSDCLVAGIEGWKQNDEKLIDKAIHDAATSILSALASPVQQDSGWRSKAADDVLAERRRQIEAEGWTPTHDDRHEDGSLAQVAGCYADPSPEMSTYSTEGYDGAMYDHPQPARWPRSWSPFWWKPTDRRRNLVKAAALILAEIERLDRIASPSKEGA